MQPRVHEYQANIITELVRVRSALHPILVTDLKTLSVCVCVCTHAQMCTCTYIHGYISMPAYVYGVFILT